MITMQQLQQVNADSTVNLCLWSLSQGDAPQTVQEISHRIPIVYSSVWYGTDRCAALGYAQRHGKRFNYTFTVTPAGLDYLAHEVSYMHEPPIPRNSQKTNIVLPPDIMQRLHVVAAERNTKVATLIRQAIVQVYGEKQ